MTFIEKVEYCIDNNKLSIEFTIDDLRNCEDMVTKEDIHNISNYDIKNAGSKNKNKKVLKSRNINDELHYSFNTGVSNGY